MLTCQKIIKKNFSNGQSTSNINDTLVLRQNHWSGTNEHRVFGNQGKAFCFFVINIPYHSGLAVRNCQLRTSLRGARNFIFIPMRSIY